MFRTTISRLAILSLGFGVFLSTSAEAQPGGRGKGGGGGGVRIGGGGGGGGGVRLGGGGGGGGIKLPGGGGVGNAGVGNPGKSINRAPAGINLPGNSAPRINQPALNQGNLGRYNVNRPDLNQPKSQPNVGQPNRTLNQNLNNTINNALGGNNPLNNNALNNNNRNPNLNRRGPNSTTIFGDTGNRGVNSLINQSLGTNVYNRGYLNNPAVRASINQNNYRGWNNYSYYGNHPWYRGPVYNPYGWYGGFFGIGYGLGNNYGYGGPGYGWGFGYGNGYGWGASNLLYRSGYGSYYNPYYSSNYGGYNYSQPIVAQTSSAELPQAVVSDFDQARQQFKNGQYQEALSSTDRAIKAEPNDAVLHEFRALTLFAMGNYDQAAGTIYSVLAVGPGWDWATLISLYPNVDVYTKQLRALETYTDNNPQSAASRFYLAYLYQTSGQKDAAVKMLKEVVAINPKDKGAAAMLQMLEGGTPSATANTSPTPNQASNPTNEPDLKTEALVGSWQATRDDGKFNLTLNKDQTFTWKFTKDQRSDELNGTYSSQGPVLVLATKDQGAMAGKVTLPSGEAKDGKADEFQFQMVGGNPNDPGLKFTR